MNIYSILKYITCLVLLNITCLVLLMTLSGCKTKSKNVAVKILEKPTFNEVFVASSDSIKLGSKLLELWYWKRVGNRVVVQEPNQDHVLYIYALPDFNPVNSYGTIGRGPGEFIVVNWGQTTDSTSILIYDIMKKELYDLELAGDSLKTKSIHPLPTFELEDRNLAKPFTMIQKLDDDLFLMKVDDMEKTTLEVMDLRKSNVLFTLPFEFENRDKLGYSPFDFNISATKKQVILGYWNMNRIEFYSISENYQLIPRVIIGNKEDQAHIQEENWKDYYVSMDTDESYVYLLNNSAVNAHAGKGTYVDIYTLEGVPIKRIVLNEYITNIMLETSKHKFYGYSQFETESVVYVYDLDKIDLY